MRSPPLISELSNTSAFERNCVLYLVQLRWPDGLVCIRCGGLRTFEFDRSRKNARIRHQFECLDCRYQFSPTTGTIFHRSHVPLTKWFLAIQRICAADRGVTAKQLQRELRVTYQTAGNMARHICLEMLEDKGFRVKYALIGEIWNSLSNETRGNYFERSDIPDSAPSDTRKGIVPDE